MKPFAGIVATAAFANILVNAGQSFGKVYLFPSRTPGPYTPPPALPKEVARHIFLQRLSTDRHGEALNLPSTIDEELALASIAAFGKPEQELFLKSTQDKPAQLLILIEGLTDANGQQLQQRLDQTKQAPSFTIADAPSSIANRKLIVQISRAGSHLINDDCTFASVLDDTTQSCRDGLSSIMQLDAQKNPDKLDDLARNIDTLLSSTTSQSLEVALVLIPLSSRASAQHDWDAAISDLHRRDTNAPPPPSQSKKPLPACFSSAEACNRETSNCTGHGLCVNKYGGGGGGDDASASAPVCFTCKCQKTVVEGRPDAFQHWGGDTCQKRDVSTPFWLIAGFTLTIVGVTSLAVGLLFSVGQEKLPGVIGAGVSRSK